MALKPLRRRRIAGGRYRRPRSEVRVVEEIGTLRLVLVAAIGISATLVGKTFALVREAPYTPMADETLGHYLLARLFSWPTVVLVACEISIGVCVILAMRIRRLLRLLEGHRS